MRRAFSLVELLIVIAIIAIVAAILFPVMSRAKTSAKEKDDAARMRQIAVAFQLYRADHDDQSYLYLYGPGHGMPWPWNSYKDMTGYLKSGDLVWCPFPNTGGITVDDFHYFRTWKEEIGELTLNHAYKPESGSVVVYCGNHTSSARDPRFNSSGTLRVGRYLFAREDTSFGVTDNTKMDIQACGRDGCSEKPRPGAYTTLRFPGEPWPPVME